MTPQHIRQIIETVTTEFHLDPAQIHPPKNATGNVLAARIKIAKRMHAENISTKEIGAALDRDHTTIVFYLGSGNKQPSALRWRKPHIAHLACQGCKRCVVNLYIPPAPKMPPPAVRPKRYLQPYAGADFREYKWKMAE